MKHRGPSDPERLARKYRPDPASGCWLWIGALNSGGYGSVWDRKTRKVASAYRLIYELLRGPIPTGLGLDHLCRNRACVNPDHLEPVTNRENILRGQNDAAQNARKTHCPRGHLYDNANTIRFKTHRRCKSCMRTYHARLRANPIYRAERNARERKRYAERKSQ